jgi:hypothetical protein
MNIFNHHSKGDSIMKKNQLLIRAVFALPALLAGCVPQAIPSTNEAYTINITAADFATGVDNPYLPFISGSTWVYEARLVDGTVERNEIEVLQEPRNVNGATATVVHDTVFADGQLVEETFDWYAQDKDGNVWYLGEEVNNYENGALVNHTGSWEWGRDGALPGIIMWGDPSAHRKEEYYQEYYAGEAEDQGQVLSVSESISIPFGLFENVVMTHDFSAIDPELKENKFYASGIGLIKEINLTTGEEVVLVEFTTPTR